MYKRLSFQCICQLFALFEGAWLLWLWPGWYDSHFHFDQPLIYKTARNRIGSLLCGNWSQCDHFSSDHCFRRGAQVAGSSVPGNRLGQPDDNAAGHPGCPGHPRREEPASVWRGYRSGTQISKENRAREAVRPSVVAAPADAAGLGMMGGVAMSATTHYAALFTSIGYSKEAAAASVSMLGICLTISKLIFGPVVDHWGENALRASSC